MSFARLKRTSGELEFMTSTDGSTWTILEGDFDLVFPLPSGELLEKLLQGATVRYLDSEAESEGE